MSISFILFWLGVVAIFLSFWISMYQHQLFLSGMLAIFVALLIAAAEVVIERTKKEKYK